MLVSENRPEWLIADLAIMAAGCVTVPTYTTNTERDHQHILDNSGASAVIVSTQKLAKTLLPAVLFASECQHIIGDRRHPHRPVAATSPHSTIGPTWSPARPTSARSSSAWPRSGATTSPASSTPAAPAARRAACMQHHGAILHNVDGCIDVIANDFGWDDEVFLSFLPASHAYEHTGGQHFPIALGAADLLRRKPREARRQYRGGAADDHGRRAAAVRSAARPDHQDRSRRRAALPTYLLDRALAIGPSAMPGKSVPLGPADGRHPVADAAAARSGASSAGGSRRWSRAARRSIPRSACSSSRSA